MSQECSQLDQLCPQCQYREFVAFKGCKLCFAVFTRDQKALYFTAVGVHLAPGSPFGDHWQSALGPRWQNGRVCCQIGTVVLFMP